MDIVLSRFWLRQGLSRFLMKLDRSIHTSWSKDHQPNQLDSWQEVYTPNCHHMSLNYISWHTFSTYHLAQTTQQDRGFYKAFHSQDPDPQTYSADTHLHITFFQPLYPQKKLDLRDISRHKLRIQWNCRHSKDWGRLLSRFCWSKLASCRKRRCWWYSYKRRTWRWGQRTVSCLSGRCLRIFVLLGPWTVLCRFGCILPRTCFLMIRQSTMYCCLHLYSHMFARNGSVLDRQTILLCTLFSNVLLYRLRIFRLDM